MSRVFSNVGFGAVLLQPDGIAHGDERVTQLVGQQRDEIVGLAQGFRAFQQQPGSAVL